MNIKDMSAEQRKEELARLADAVKAAKAETKTAKTRAAEQARKADPFKALAEKYAKAYPDCKAFHITSDRQVFLDKDKNLAQYHQKGLGEGEVRTINVR